MSIIFDERKDVTEIRFSWECMLSEVCFKGSKFNLHYSSVIGNLRIN